MRHALAAILALTWAITAAAQVGSTPVAHEELIVGGGYEETVPGDGGIDFTKTGDILMEGDLQVDGPIVVGGALRVFNTINTLNNYLEISIDPATGAAFLDLHANPQDGSSDATINFGFNTNTSGTRLINIYKGDGSATVTARFNMAIGSLRLDGVLAVNNAAGITSDEATVALLDVTPTKVDFAGNAAVDIGKTGLATTVKGTLNVDEAVTLDTTLGVGGTTTLSGSSTQELHLIGTDQSDFHQRDTGATTDQQRTVLRNNGQTWRLHGLLDNGSISKSSIINASLVTGDISFGFNAIVDGDLTVGNIVGPVDIGDDTNDLLIAADGFTTLAGTARAVMEMKHNALQLLGPGPGNPPAGPNLTGHTFTLDFEAANDEEVYVTMELPHNWAAGTTIKVNFHWAPIDNGAGTVTWGVETKIITPESGTLVEASVATQIVIDDTQTTEDELLESDTITIDTSGASAGDFLAMRIFRDANASEGGASDSYTSDAQLVAFHMLYIVDSFGSDEAW